MSPLVSAYTDLRMALRKGGLSCRAKRMAHQDKQPPIPIHTLHKE